jgi:hypothetical protein
MDRRRARDSKGLRVLQQFYHALAIAPFAKTWWISQPRNILIKARLQAPNLYANTFMPA